jgi:hypothetical protein
MLIIPKSSIPNLLSQLLLVAKSPDLDSTSFPNYNLIRGTKINQKAKIWKEEILKGREKKALVKKWPIENKSGKKC